MSLRLSYFGKRFLVVAAKIPDLWQEQNIQQERWGFHQLNLLACRQSAWFFFCRKHKKADTFHLTFIFWQNEKAVFPSPPPKYINLSGIHGYQSIITLHFRGCLTSNFMLLVVAQYEYVTNKTSFELKRSLIWSYKFFCLSAQDALSREFLAIQFMRNH